MTICYFGDFDPKYSRTRTILMGLERIGVPVVYCNETEKGWKKYWKLFKRYRGITTEHDIVFVGFGEGRLMPVFARLITRKPIFWEALFSQYDNWVFDRKYVKPHSLKAYLYWFMDWIGCMASDIIVLDTATHADYFVDTFNIPRKKFAHVYVGADTTIFYPRERDNSSRYFEVEFHGKYIPMQGTDVIVRAAKILEDEGIHFTLIGSGQEAKRTRALAEELKATNVTFHGFLSQDEITEFVRNADVCIGLVGSTPRVVRPLPTKVWEAAAMERLSINVNSASLREVFTPGVNVIGIAPGDHKELARVILGLKKSGDARKMEKAARQRFLDTGTPEIIAQSLVEVIQAYFSRQTTKRV